MIDFLIVITFTAIFILIWYFFQEVYNNQWKTPKLLFPMGWNDLLEQNINYYTFLSPEEKIKFQQRIHTFLFNVKITGIKTKVTDLDKIYISSSAIIPVFNFPNWEYDFLEEVLLFPDDFTIKIQEKESPKMKGLVGGSGYLNGKMMFSRKALVHGFENNNDNLNVGIHEFAHLIDKEDGRIDGVPEILLKNKSIAAWIHLTQSKISEILKNKSDIRPYGATRSAEFLAVTTEYFFERPIIMKKKHPKLYAFISSVYKQNPALKKQTFYKISKTKTEDKCPCGSGLAFKNCCTKYNIND